MSEHEQQGEDLERELGDMERQAEQLEGRIAETRADWERKKADDGVPGAADNAEPEGPETEEGAPPASSSDD